MMGYTEAPRAWGRTDSMARVLGISLAGAVVDGWMSRKELAGLVGRCNGCGHGRDCTGWMANVRRAGSLPEYCPNKAALEEMV